MDAVEDAAPPANDDEAGATRAGERGGLEQSPGRIAPAALISIQRRGDNRRKRLSVSSGRTMRDHRVSFALC